ncbi:MAG: sodium ion-translocating decarboxylase subunit beta, partial [Clostridia bacterium]|nr:sodium ion-translocating decarboxylase subunit beta [Clostridia bacterium]
MNFSLNLLGSEVWGEIVSSLATLWERTGLYELVDKFAAGGWQSLVMIAIACLLVYLAVVKKFEPLLLLPIAFGMFIVNIPGAYKILFGTK